MSKINAIRLINLNYNNNGIHVDDETFYLDGESTLLSLRNGGGKSVLVQMLIAPFVHKRYRNNKDRLFSGYFTTNKPTFILIEWKLDGNSGYVLTGMMVRKSQEVKEDQGQEDLDILQFIHEYKGQNQYDIHKIPFVKIIDDNKRLMKYSYCKDLLETLKFDKEYKFFSYDMNNPNAARNYYNKLEEYQIYNKEWEAIVKKINLKESGLSELFTNAKDEAGLIETWFLPTIENKLNRSKNRIEEFRDILSKYIKQFKDNKSKIDQKHVIIQFKEETKEVLNIAETLNITTKEKKGLENRIANLIIRLNEIRSFLESERIELEDKESLINDEIRQIEHEELSFEIYKLEDESLTYANELSQVLELIKKKEEDNRDLTKKKNIQECSKIHTDYQLASEEVQSLESKLELIKEEDKDRTPEREALGYSLRNYYEKAKEITEIQIDNLEKELNNTRNKVKSIDHELDSLDKKEKEEISNLSGIKVKIGNYDICEKKFNSTYKENLKRNILNEYEDGSLDIRLKKLKDLIEEMGLELGRRKKNKIDNDEKLKLYKRQIQDKGNLQGAISQEIKGIEDEIVKLDEEIEIRKSIIKHIGFSEDRIFDYDGILAEFKRRAEEVKESVEIYKIV